MDNHIDKVLEAWKDLQDPKGTLDANTALNTIVNNLQFSENVSKKGLSALDITGKKDDVTINHEIISALAQRFARQEGEVWDDLKNPNGKINPKAAESVLLNEIARKEHLATLGINKNPDILQEASELKSLVSKRHVRDGLNVWDDLKNPKGELDANVARFLIHRSFKEAGLTLAALDITEKKDEKAMTAELEKALSERGRRDKKKDIDGISERVAGDKKQEGWSLDAIVKFVEDLGKPSTTPNTDTGTPRQFTPPAPKEVTRGTKR